MKGKELFEQGGRYLTIMTLVVLPWQTRYIFWRPWVGTTEGEFGVISLYATMVLSVLAAVLLGLAQLEEEKKKTWMLPVSIATVIFLGGLFILTYPTETHAWILNFVSALALGYAVYRSAKKNISSLCLAFVAGLAPSLMLGIGQVIQGMTPASSILGLAARSAEHLGDAVIIIKDERVLRMYGVFPHPNIFGTALALVGGIMMTLFGDQMKKMHASAGIGALLGGALLISRGAALALGCAMLMAYAIREHKRNLIKGIVLVPVIVWLLQFLSPGMLAIRGQSALEQRSLTERVLQVQEWGRVMQEHGLLGTGIYQYANALAKIHGPTMPAWAYQPIHHTLLLIIAEGGLLMIGGGVVLCVVLARKYSWEEGKKIGLRGAPLLIVLWSLVWFDHALWTSWSGMAYTATTAGLFISSLDR
ncbi:O-antigen ligase family protein [bacterium]|nr:O-antigen ligase family protein [bacterium]NBX49220.1 O-antigen ligase family protein [bacterium]